ncbi:MAG TPA: hypothetical protein VGJ26_18750 [Pirellulales bacterium]|jgi:hypothetical protein
MSIVQQARDALQRATAPEKLDVSEGRQRLTSELAAVDSLAVGFTTFTLATDSLSGATTDELKRLGEKLSARLTYLLEPISAIEIDREGCVLQMRSNPPQRDDDQTTYYELVLRRGGEMRLSRYSKAPGDARQKTIATVTREVFLRLVADFAAVAPQ